MKRNIGQTQKAGLCGTDNDVKVLSKRRQQQEGTYVHHVTLQLGDNMVEFPIMKDSRISIRKGKLQLLLNGLDSKNQMLSGLFQFLTKKDGQLEAVIVAPDFNKTSHKLLNKAGVKIVGHRISLWDPHGDIKTYKEKCEKVANALTLAAGLAMDAEAQLRLDTPEQLPLELPSAVIPEESYDI
jgi:hypothetical protein